MRRPNREPPRRLVDGAPAGDVALVGCRSDGQAFDMRGVTLFQIVGDQIAAGRLYRENIERDAAGIEVTVETLSGRRPQRT
jgi:hypothetical protein